MKTKNKVNILELTPGVNGSIVKLYFNNNWYDKGDRIIHGPNNNIELQIISKPRRKWHHLLIQFITFGLFKANYLYKVKLKQASLNV